MNTITFMRFRDLVKEADVIYVDSAEVADKSFDDDSVVLSVGDSDYEFFFAQFQAKADWNCRVYVKDDNNDVKVISFFKTTPIKP